MCTPKKYLKKIAIFVLVASVTFITLIIHQFLEDQEVMTSSKQLSPMKNVDLEIFQGQNLSVFSLNDVDFCALEEKTKLKGKSIHYEIAGDFVEPSFVLEKDNGGYNDLVIEDPEYKPECNRYDINTLIPATPVSGESYCAYFHIPERSRTLFTVINQSESRQVRTQLIQDTHADHKYSILATSNKTDDKDDIYHVTEPGHYYFLLHATKGDGGNIHTVAAVNKNIDKYEPNDDMFKITKLSEGYNKIKANIDYENDVDCYSLLAKEGQHIVFGLKAPSSDTNNEDSPWILEVRHDDTDWTPVAVNGNYLVDKQDKFYRLYARVRKHPNSSIDRSFYDLRMGYRIKAIEKAKVEHGTREFLSKIPGNFSAQVHKHVAWKAKLLDSNGKGIQGAEVKLAYFTSKLPLSYSIANTGIDGFAGESVIFPKCDGDNSTVHLEKYGDYKGWYSSRYNTGGWRMTVPDALLDDDVVIGKNNYLNLAHICRQTSIEAPIMENRP